MACSIVRAERMSVEGLSDSPDSQQLRTIFAQYAVPSDPIDCPEEDAIQEQNNSSIISPVNLTTTVYTKANNNVASAPIEHIELQHRSEPPTFSQNPVDLPRSDTDIYPNVQSDNLHDNNGREQITLSELRERLRRHHSQREMGPPNFSSNESHSSTLSTTQEIDEALYAKYTAQGITHESPKALSATSTGQDTQELPWPSQSARSTLQTHPSYDTGEDGHITLDFEPGHPSRDSAVSKVHTKDDVSPKIHHGLFGQRPLDPETPAPVRLPFAKKTGDTIPLGELFSLTQPPNTGGFQSPFLPSSTRPSPGMFNTGRLALQAGSSPTIARIIQPHHPSSKAYLSSSPPANIDSPAIENRTDFCESNIKVADTSFLASSLARRNITEPLEVYTSRKASQERREQQKQLSSDEDEDPSDQDMFVNEFEQGCRARRVQKAAADEIAAAEARRGSPQQDDLVEVPSTAKRRRSVQEDYVAQCSGTDARDTQEEETLIMDSQGRLAITQEEVLQAENEDHVTSSHPSNSRAKFETTEYFASAPELALQRTSKAFDNSAHKESSNSLPARPLTQPLQESAFNTENRSTTAGHKETPLSEADAMVPETSPARPRYTTFAEIDSQSPVPSASNLIDFTSIPGFTPDEDADTLLRSSDPVESPSRRRRRRQKAIKTAKGDSSQLTCVNNNIQLHTDNSMANDGHHTLNSLAPVPRNTAKKVASAEASEYVTAPEERSLPLALAKDISDSHSTVHPQSNPKNGKKSGLLTSKCQTLKHTKQPTSEEDVVDLGSRGGTTQSSPLSSAPSTMPSDVESEESLMVDVPHTEADTEITLKDFRLNSCDKLIVPEDLVSKTGVFGVSTPSQSESKRTSTTTDSSARRKEAQEAIVVAVDPLTRPSTGQNVQIPSARALRALTKAEGTNSATPNRTTNASVTKTGTRWSKRTSTNNSDKAPSVEPTESPLRSLRRALTPSRMNEQGLFHNMAFSVSYTYQGVEKDRILNLLRQNGAAILDTGFHELFDSHPSISTTPTKGRGTTAISSSATLALLPGTHALGFTCLVADEHSRKAKYMQALALGLPCLSGRWVEDCVQKKSILDWEPYLLAAGNSSFLNGAVRNRNLRPYPAITSKFADCFHSREKLLDGKSIILVMGKGKEKDRKKAYLFLTKALGARRILEVVSQEEANRVLAVSQDTEEQWDWIYHDTKKEETGNTSSAQARKRKRVSAAEDGLKDPIAKRTKIIGDEYVIQSLILGKLME